MDKGYYEVETETEMWNKAHDLFPYDYDRDETASERAGYPVYRAAHHPMCWISDLGCRLELNFNDKTINIWLKQHYTKDEVRTMIQSAKETLEQGEKICQLLDSMNATDLTKMVLSCTRNMMENSRKRLSEFGL